MPKAVVDNKLFSLSEWYQGINHPRTNELREEDNNKRKRLEILFKEVDLPYDRADQFPAQTVADRKPEFFTYLENNKNRLCAFRLVPLDPSLPKLRLRGKSVNDALKWFNRQKIDFSKYRLEIVPHAETTLWSSIFVVNSSGLIGEVLNGGLNLLSMGSAKTRPVFFKYDFNQWKFSDNNPKAKKIVKEVTGKLKIKDKNKQAILKKKLKARFINDYLAGYFEFFIWSDGTYFTDYNRLLGDLIKISDFTEIKNSQLNLKGVCGYPGRAEGQVVIVRPGEINKVNFKKGDILVCESTTPNYLPLIKKAGAIITDQGGILSHAAIVARELKIPCIIGTGRGTKTLKSKGRIKIDAQKGLIEKA